VELGVTTRTVLTNQDRHYKLIFVPLKQVILAVRKQVRGVSAMYGHHFRLSRQRARAFTRESLFMHLLLEMFLYNLAMIVGGA
jgi:hypothetical protein